MTLCLKSQHSLAIKRFPLDFFFFWGGGGGWGLKKMNKFGKNKSEFERMRTKFFKK